MMQNTKKCTEKLGIRFPIIQAPMAGGATTPELVAAVSNAGGLGSWGAGYMAPNDIRKAIKRIRELTEVEEPYIDCKFKRVQRGNKCVIKEPK